MTRTFPGMNISVVPGMGCVWRQAPRSHETGRALQPVSLHSIWHRCTDNLLLYRVVEILGVGFVVQSRDFIYPDAAQERIHRLDRQFEELMFEMPPELRMRPRSSIKEAVAEFDRQFQDDA